MVIVVISMGIVSMRLIQCSCEKIPTALRRDLTGSCGGWTLLAHLTLQQDRLLIPPTLSLLWCHSSPCLPRKHCTYPSYLHLRHVTTSARADSGWRRGIRLGPHSNLASQRHLWHPEVVRNQFVMSIPEPAGRSPHFVTRSLIRDRFGPLSSFPVCIHTTDFSSACRTFFLTCTDAILPITRCNVAIFTLGLLFSNSFATLQNMPLEREKNSASVQLTLPLHKGPAF